MISCHLGTLYAVFGYGKGGRDIAIFRCMSHLPWHETYRFSVARPFIRILRERDVSTEEDSEREKKEKKYENVSRVSSKFQKEISEASAPSPPRLIWFWDQIWPMGFLNNFGVLHVVILRARPNSRLVSSTLGQRSHLGQTNSPKGGISLNVWSSRYSCTMYSVHMYVQGVTVHRVARG